MTAPAPGILSALRRRFRLLTPRERRQWSILSAIGLLRAFLETVAGGVLYAVLLALVNPGSTESWPQTLRRWVAALRDPDRIVWVLLALAALQAGKTLLLLTVELLHTHWVARASAELSARLFRSYL